MAVAAVSQFDPAKFFQSPAAGAPGAQRLDTKVSAISTATDLTGQLSVTTAEGDKITLTADFAARYRAVNLQAQAQTENGTVNVSAKSIEATLKQQYGVTVQGDLNPQELSDLEKLFKKVGSIFSNFFNGKDDEALAKTAKLADKFGGLSSLSSLDLSINVERSVTVLAAQVASDVTGQPALPTNPAPASTATTSPATAGTPGAAPSTAAAIPQSSTGTTAPTQPSTAAAAPATTADGVTRLVAPAPDASPPKSLVQQVLDALDQGKVESEKVRKYLPDFLKKLRENLGRELRGDRPHHGQEPGHQVAATTPDSTVASDQASGQTPNPAPTQTPASVSVAVLAYQSYSRSNITLSIRS